MNSEISNFIRSKVRGAQPQAARFYYLVSHMGRYPSSGGYNLDPFQLPLGVQTGVYRIQFLADYTQTEPLPPKITGTPHPTLELHVSDVVSPDVSLTPKSKHSELELRYQDPIFNDRRHLKDRIEYKAEMFAADLTENQMLLGKKFKHMSEMAETFVLMRTMRREMLQNIEAMGEASRKSLQLSQEAGEAYVAAKKDTPEPPPRQTSPFESLLTSLPGLLNLANMFAKGAIGSKDDGDDAPIDASLDGDTRRLQKEARKLKKQLADKLSHKGKIQPKKRIGKVATDSKRVGKAAAKRATVAKTETAKPGQPKVSKTKTAKKKDKSQKVKGSLPAKVTE